MNASLVTAGASVPSADDGVVPTREGAGTTRATIPAGELYWALLDPTALGPRSPRQLRELAERCAPELIDLLAPKLPVDTADVHSIFAVLGDGRVLAVAVPLDKLGEVGGPQTLAVTPDALPQALDNDIGAIPPTLNFLVGDHEPEPVRAARRRVDWIVALAIALATGLTLIGLERRMAATRAEALNSLTATEGVIRQVVGRSVDRNDGIAAIAGELQRLRQTRMRPDSGEANAPFSLAALMAAWPRGEEAPRVRTETISIGQGTMTLGVTADNRAAAVSISEAVRRIKGWTLIQPQMSAADDKTGSVRLQLRFVPDHATDGDGHP